MEHLSPCKALALAQSWILRNLVLLLYPAAAVNVEFPPVGLIKVYLIYKALEVDVSPQDAQFNIFP